MKPTMCAAACYGTGNLGDDAIFAGVYRQYREIYEVCQIYVCQPTHPRAISEVEVLNTGYPGGTERLVIGGGGLFYDSHMTENMIRFADMAVDKGIDVSLEGAGFETSREDCYELISNLLSKCSKITVRSIKSQNIVAGIGFESEVVRDFAYNLTADSESARRIMPIYDESLPVIGVATASGIHNLVEPVGLVTTLLEHFNVLHLPHVRHLISKEGNEVAKGELIWSSLGVLEPCVFNRYKALQYPDSPEALLGVYAMLDGVISYRFHPCIFAEMVGIPVYARTGPEARKVKSYFDEHPDVVGLNDHRPVQSTEVIPDIVRFFREKLKWQQEMQHIEESNPTSLRNTLEAKVST